MRSYIGHLAGEPGDTVEQLLEDAIGTAQPSRAVVDVGISVEPATIERAERGIDPDLVGREQRRLTVHMFDCTTTSCAPSTGPL